MAYVNGDFSVTVVGTMAGVEEFSNSWAFFTAGTAGVIEDCVGALNAFYTELATGGTPIWSDQVEIVDATTVDLFTGTPEPITWESITGNSAVNLLPLECALRLSFATVTGANGGPFLPALRTASVDSGGQLLASYQNVVRDALAAMFDAVDTAGGVVSLHRPTVPSLEAVTVAKVGRTFDVIRRRRNALPEAYVAV